MTFFLLNIMLAVLWCFTWGSFHFYTLTTGFVLGYVLLGLYSRGTAMEGYGRKGSDLLKFGLYFIRVLVMANLEIALEIITPGLRLTPRIVRFDVRGLTPTQRTMLINVINLTPGTLVVDIAPDRRTFYVHCMYARDHEQAITQLNDLKRRMERLVF